MRKMSIPDLLRKHRGKIALLLLLAALAAWFLYVHRADLSRETLSAYGRGLPAIWFVLAFLILPLVGFPMSIFLVLAGIRFGFGGGMALTAAGMFFHHFASYRLVHGWFREPVRRRLEKAGHAIPPIKEKHRIWFTALFAAIHGPPYAAKLYLLALTDLPFAIYFWIAAPVYILFGAVTVGAGSAVMNFDPTWIYILVGVFTVILLGGYWLKRRYGNAAFEQAE